MNLISILEEMKEVCQKSDLEDCNYCSFKKPCEVISCSDLYGPCVLNIDEIKEDLGIHKEFNYQEVINHYGNNAQIAITQEELAELIQSLSKALRTDVGTARDSVLEELGDVTLCLEYIKLIFGITEKDIRDQVKLKQDRLLKEMGK